MRKRGKKSRRNRRETGEIGQLEARAAGEQVRALLSKEKITVPTLLKERK
jgi:hypothetical protein